MSKKINKYDDFVNEEFKLSPDTFKGLLDKVKSIVPKDKIKSFIEDNKDEVERVKNLITKEDGSVDYSKAFNLVKKGVDKK